jgi:hypothetical protein
VSTLKKLDDVISLSPVCPFCLSPSFFEEPKDQRGLFARITKNKLY